MTLRSTYEWLDEGSTAPPHDGALVADVEEELPEWFLRDPVLQPGLVYVPRSEHTGSSAPNTYNDELHEAEEAELEPLQTMEEPVAAAAPWVAPIPGGDDDELQPVSIRTVPVPRPVAPHRRGDDPQLDRLRDGARARLPLPGADVAGRSPASVDERMLMALGVGMVAAMMCMWLIMLVGRAA
jgi:hypothetical protein